MDPNDLPVLVPLPSLGLLYDKEFPLHKKESLYIKTLTVREENLFLNKTFYKDKSVYDRLISEVVIEPKLTLEEASKLVSGDKQAIIISARITGYGSVLDYEQVCPKCEIKKKQTLKLNKTKVQSFDPSLAEMVGTNLFEITTPQTQRVFTFSFPTDFGDNSKDEAETPVEFFEKHLVGVDGTTPDPQLLREAYENLPSQDCRFLLRTIKKMKPSLFIVCSFRCQECDIEQEIDMVCNESLLPKPEDKEIVLIKPFFILAYYVGITWSDYLTLPVEYKKRLIELTNEEIERSSKNKHNVPTKAPHHNDAQIRALTGKTKAFPTNARLQRFT